MSTKEMMLEWLRMRDRGMAAVGRIQDARFVVVLSFLTSFVSMVGILQARKRAWSLVRRTRMEEEVVVWGSEGSRGM
jgi:membrane-associated PAP2 superfamily phosphatase